MTCGTIEWWRAPDIAGLLERHGQAEHLAVQADFLVQVQRNGRAEFSIPAASKKRNGETGYADIVSIATGEIWEIKPEKLEDQAVKESAWYAEKAVASCGPQWRPGTLYAPSNFYKNAPGVVWRTEGNGNKAELFAKQGRPGAVLYHWEVNGKRDSSLEAAFGWALRGGIVADYFASTQTLQPLPGSRAPNNLPPGRFKPPVLDPGACIPELGGFVPALVRSMRTRCAPVIFDNAAIAVLLEEPVFNALVGPRLVARQISLLQVKSRDPQERLYRETLTVLSGAAAAHGVIGLVIVVSAVVYLVIVSAPRVIGPVVAFVVGDAAVAGGAVASEGLLGSLAAGLSGVVRAATAAGTAIVVFAIPRASRADPGKPVALDVSAARFRLLTPAEAPSARVGQHMSVDGADYIVAGIATTLPD